MASAEERDTQPVVGKVVFGVSHIEAFQDMAKAMGWQFVDVKVAKEQRKLRKARKPRRVNSKLP